MQNPSGAMFADYWLPGNGNLPARHAANIDTTSPPPVSDPLIGFGFVSQADGGYALPAGTVALQAEPESAHPALIELLKTIGVPSKATIWSGARRVGFYRVPHPNLVDLLARVIPDGVTLLHAGERVDLSGFSPADLPANSLAELSELSAADIRNVTAPDADPPNLSNPLLPFSLRGQSERFRRMAVEARPLLGEVCLRGQVTLWYAAPNTGKTLVALSLILEAVGDGRIAAGNVFYVNADDNGQGFATKLQLMDDLGAHTMAPGFKGFVAKELIPILHRMADRDEARGLLVVIDTAKKFVDLMSKSDASAFSQALRRVAMMGGTVLGLAHTAKNGNGDGTPRYAGTTDLVDDADAAYTLKLLDGGLAGEKVVEFRCFKARGECAETAAYAFGVEKGLAYEEKIASVRLVDAAQLDEFQRVEAQRSDAEVIEAVAACIAEGINTKMLLMKEVATRTGVSARAAGRLIERYTGDDPAQHRWRFDRGERGAQVFALLSPPPPA